MFGSWSRKTRRKEPRWKAQDFGPALFIEPSALMEQTARGARDHHLIGVHRISAVRLVAPKSYQPIEGLKYVQGQHVVRIASGDEWMLELSFDGGKQKRSRDFRPGLPLVIRY
jgi:hypothetical protein